MINIYMFAMAIQLNKGYDSSISESTVTSHHIVTSR